MKVSKTRIGSAKKFLFFGLGGVVIAAAIWMIFFNGDPSKNSVDAGKGKAKAVKNLDKKTDDVSISLSPDNTEIKWTGSNAVGLSPTGYFFQLGGNAVVDKDKKLKHIEIDIDMNGVKAKSSTLTKKLKHDGFFEVDKFPTSKFISTGFSFEARPGDPEGTNCVIEGNFQLRDVTHSIKIPVNFSFVNDALKLTSEFKINRKDYGVVYSDSTQDLAIRDSVVINVSIDSKTEEKSAVSPKVAETKSVQPKTNFTETIRPTLVKFDMIYIPGDKEKGIKPYYIGKTEVTWDEFDYWALCKDLSEKDSVNEISKLLRPSSPHNLEKTYRGWGREGQPAVGLSRLSAELYCKWLSKQTGRKYRLPTSAEWDLAYKLGGGDLNATQPADQLLKTSWFMNNAITEDDEGFVIERAMKVAKLAPNKLGMYDMLGNAAEWVHDEGEEKVVRGGNFHLAADELTGSHREVEDQLIWNKDYPQEPKSIWWYVNADYVGFRVVCEAE